MSFQAGKRKFLVKTLGCKVNQYESQAMREILVKNGFKECLAEDIADIYIVNTCTVTGRADRESRYWLGHFHKANPNARIVVTGCYIETGSDDVSFLPGVRHILRNADKGRIAEILNNPGARHAADAAQNESYAPLSVTGFSGHTKAFVKIEDGCENRCAYCKVPLVRGPVRSRPLNDILKEVRILSGNGFREMVLTGICLGAWGKDLSGKDLTDVLRALDKLPGDFRIRLSSIEPRYVTDALLKTLAGSRRFCRHLHIPFQSGDDRILRRMKRPYTVKKYRSLADRVRKRIDQAAITTDMLIGFPGETEADFRNTLRFVKDILPARTHIFTYSPREGTAAYRERDVTEKEVLRKRYNELKAAAVTTSYLYRKKFLKKTLDILVETRRDRQSGLLTGYSDNYIKAVFDGPDDLMGRIVPVRLTEVNLGRTAGVYGAA